MSPRKQPTTLFDICIKSSIRLINTTCSVIAESYSENELNEREKQIAILKNHLMSLLPPSFFDILCAARTCYPYRADPHIQLNILMHPNMTVFRKCDLDIGISQRYWIETFSCFKKLVVLDIEIMCIDKILQIISVSCPLLEELNIVCQIDNCKLPFNISDAGLCSIAKLKQLRILSINLPRNLEVYGVRRCVSKAGIIMLVSELPYLEELRIDSFDIGSILNTTNMEIGPLSLRKIVYKFAIADGIETLIKLCPYLEELSVANFSNYKDLILDQISASDLRLTALDLSHFSYTRSLEQFLVNKGSYLTHFIWENENSLTLDAVLAIGLYCPNLYSLCLMTEFKTLVVSQNVKRPNEILKKLRILQLTFFDNFAIDNTLLFFLECTSNLQELSLNFESRTNIENTLLIALEKNYFINVSLLCLQCTLVVSKEVVIRIIEKCEKLRYFTVDCKESDMSDVQYYIQENNLDLTLRKPSHDDSDISIVSILNTCLNTCL